MNPQGDSAVYWCELKICNKCRYIPFLSLPFWKYFFFFFTFDRFSLCVFLYTVFILLPTPLPPFQSSIMLHRFLPQVLDYYAAPSFKKLSEQQGACFLWSFVINSRLTWFLSVLSLGKNTKLWLLYFTYLFLLLLKAAKFLTVAAIAQRTALLVPEVANIIHQAMSAKPN